VDGEKDEWQQRGRSKGPLREARGKGEKKKARLGRNHDTGEGHSRRHEKKGSPEGILELKKRPLWGGNQKLFGKKEGQMWKKKNAAVKKRKEFWPMRATGKKKKKTEKILCHQSQKKTEGKNQKMPVKCFPRNALEASSRGPWSVFLINEGTGKTPNGQLRNSSEGGEARAPL